MKKEENIPKFYFCVRAPTFSTHIPCPLKICFTNKVNTIRGVGQLLVTGSQGPITRVPGVRIHVPGSQVPRSRVPVPKSLGPKSQGPGSQSLGLKILGLRVPDLRIPCLRSQGPGSQVSGPDFGLCLLKHVNM